MKSAILSASLFLLCSLPLRAQRIIEAEHLLTVQATTGEGSIWHDGRHSLFFVDIEGEKLLEYAPSTEECKTWHFDKMVTTVVPESDTTVIIALQDEVERFNLVTEERETLSAIPSHGGDFRTNDGKCDPEGCLWVGNMRFKGNGPSGQASLYRLNTDGTLTEKITGVTISNGIVWTSNRKYMYYNDTPTGRIARYRYDAATGDIVFDGIAVTLAPGTGGPDGMTIDSDDNLWVAQWGGYGVYCYDPMTGELLARVSVPVPNVASCTFGGENLDVLYITTARAWLSREKLDNYPQSGDLFKCIVPGVRGVAANYFGTHNPQ